MKMDDLGQAKSRIQFAEAMDPSIKIDDLHVASPAVCVMLSEPHASMNASERVLITGDNGEHKALLFRAIGGLWPWGSGQITHPARNTIMFMPVRAYIPPGSLRAAVTYPRMPGDYDTPAIAEALAAVGLEHFEHRLDDKIGIVDRFAEIEARPHAGGGGFVIAEIAQVRGNA